MNYRRTTHFEYFKIVKVRNLTFITIYESFKIHAEHKGAYKEVFSFLPKGGALLSVTEIEVSLNGEGMTGT